MASKDLDNPDFNFLKEFRFNAANKDIFDRELLIVIMCAAVQVIMENTTSEEKSRRVLDSMNNDFINSWKPEDKQSFSRYFTSRYKEYTDARKEKRGLNDLWPLSYLILKNLHGKETINNGMRNLSSIMLLRTYYSCLIEYFGEKMKRIQITN